MIKHSAMIIILLSMIGCTFDSTVNSSIDTESDTQKVLSNTITKLTISGDSLYIFTDAGYSLASDITNPNELISYENNIVDGFVITYLKGLSYVYSSFSPQPDKSFNLKTFENGALYDEISHRWIADNPNFNVTYEMAEKGETLYAARYTSGMTIIKDRKYYLTQIDTIVGNIKEYPYKEVTDTTSIFEIGNFRDSIVTIPKNDVSGVKIFNDQIIAQTWDGIYTSTDGDVWHKNDYMKDKAKECIESSEGIVNGSKVFYTMYVNKVNHDSWDTLYTGDMTNHGLYVSSDNLETFTYFPKFRDKVIGSEEFMHMSSHNDKIIIATSDSVYTGVYNGTSFTWKTIAINSTMATAVNCVAINDDTYFLGSANAGVLYSNDFTNWNYITKSKTVATDLEEVYAYPSVISISETKARFAYSISAVDLVTIEIFDYNGDLVKTIIKDESRPAATATEKSTHFEKDVWDGKNSKGESVPPGTYTFKIETKNSKLSATGKVIVGVIRWNIY